MTIFAEKLSTLVETLRAGTDAPTHAIAAALRQGATRNAVAIGSGGSAIMAEFLARCRETLGHRPTLVMTPMEAVMSQRGLDGADVWIFTAGANNPDAAAAFAAAMGSSAESVTVVTVNPSGATARNAATDDRSQVVVIPVAERKDGFLATHSLVAMAAATLAGADRVADGGGRADLVERLAAEFEDIAVRTRSQELSFRPGDTVLVLHDPQCRTLATLIETSLWETAIAPVQRTDFRNFAHGRHVWAARNPERMFVVALTAAGSRDIWSSIRAALPSTVRSVDVDLGHGGRFRTVTSIAEGLELVRALGEIAGIDPGRPGRGDFAEAIYDDRGLYDVAWRLGPAVRHKLAAVQLHDDPTCPETQVCSGHADWIERLSTARIGGVVLDYDGTVVSTEARLSPPSSEVLAELVRLADAGIAIGFATGRGGSAGTALREALPSRIHRDVVVGYYNGGHIRTLDVDIEDDQPDADAELEAFADWLEGEGLLAPGTPLKRGRVQIALRHEQVVDPAEFAARVGLNDAVASGRVAVLSSHHSFDLVPATTSKTSVTTRMIAKLGDASTVLAIGDSGEPGGNDRELLGRPPSISVDGVCGHLDGNWSLFGRTATGPAALLRILRALRVEDGHARLDTDSLGADQE